MSELFSFRLKQVLNDLLGQQLPPSSSAAAWQTQKRGSAQESSCGPSASPGVSLPFSSTLHPSANNMPAPPMSPFPSSMSIFLRISDNPLFSWALMKREVIGCSFSLSLKLLPYSLHSPLPWVASSKNLLVRPLPNIRSSARTPTPPLKPST